MNVGIVIPAYNEQERLGAVLLKVKQYICNDFICVIDDGSDDETLKIARIAQVKCIRFAENKGKGEALKAGFAWAASQHLDAVITLDGDGQHDPDLIPEFIQTMQIQRCDVVLGTRRFRLGEMPFDRILSNKISSFFVSIASRKHIADSQSGFRMYRLSAIESLKLQGSLYELESEILIHLARRQAAFCTCPVPASYSGAPSHIHRTRDIGRFLRIWFSLILKRKKDL